MHRECPVRHVGLVMRPPRIGVQKDDKSIRNEVILGVDTHLDTHVAAVISSTGQHLGTLAAPTSGTGYFKLLVWAPSWGCLRRAGVEGTGIYGTGLARVLRE